MSGTALQRCEVHYSGHVQGVGFRYTIRTIAGNYDVTGYVRNLPDGRVQITAEAQAAELDRFLDEVAERLSHHIHDVQTDMRPGMGVFASFKIRY